MDQFTSADDIRYFIDSHISDDVVADVEAARNEALRIAQNWCDSDCTSVSATFLKGIFGHMNGGRCVDASVFCGECQARASSYFAVNTLPCCIERVVQKGIEVNCSNKALFAMISCPGCVIYKLDFLEIREVSKGYM